MQPLQRKPRLSLATALFCVLGLQSGSTPAGSRAQAPERLVACRVLEAHTSQQLRLTLVVFHHRDEKERGRLGTLLRERSGATVEFQAADGAWHSATVLRLKSCFGRGLLLFPAGTAQLADRDELVLKFPAD